MAPTIRLLGLDDLPALYAHHQRHEAENGRDGDVLFSPFDEPRPMSLEKLEKRLLPAWGASAKAIGWERTWGVVDGEQIVGELRLVHPLAVPSTLHRALLMMGIERSHRGQGWGSALIATALKWAREEQLDWVQLQVFEHNAPARALYRKFGFVEAGRVPDLFRVRGQSVADITMLLAL